MSDQVLIAIIWAGALFSGIIVIMRFFTSKSNGDFVRDAHLKAVSANIQAVQMQHDAGKVLEFKKK